MLKFKESVVIDQPVERVFSFATDLNNNVRWQSEVLEVAQTSAGPFGLGATYRCVNKFMGRRVETEGLIFEYEPQKKCSFKFTSGPVTGESSFLFEPVESGTMFTTTGELNLGFFSLTQWIVRRVAKELIQKDLMKLKHVLENGHGRERN